MKFISLNKSFSNKNQNKIVYRFISESERISIEKKDIQNLGEIWEKQSSGNNHKYEKNTRYIHFIDNKKDAMIIYKELGSIKDYLCAYSIPKKILRKYQGKGFYMTKGYTFYETVKEYAIPTKEFNPEWLISTKTISEFLNEESSGLNC